jgi:hypothetical protein
MRAAIRSLLVDSHILSFAPNLITTCQQKSGVCNPIAVSNQAELTVWRITKRNSFIASENMAA